MIFSSFQRWRTSRYQTRLWSTCDLQLELWIDIRNAWYTQRQRSRSLSSYFVSARISDSIKLIQYKSLISVIELLMMMRISVFCTVNIQNSGFGVVIWNSSPLRTYCSAQNQLSSEVDLQLSLDLHPVMSLASRSERRRRLREFLLISWSWEDEYCCSVMRSFFLGRDNEGSMPLLLCLVCICIVIPSVRFVMEWRS